MTHSAVSCFVPVVCTGFIYHLYDKCAVYHIEIIYNSIFCAIWNFEFTFLKLQHEWWETETCTTFFGTTIAPFQLLHYTVRAAWQKRKKKKNTLQSSPAPPRSDKYCFHIDQMTEKDCFTHQGPLCSVFSRISGISAVLPLSWDGWDAVEWKHTKLSCRTTGVCLSGTVTRILIPGYVLRQRLS